MSLETLGSLFGHGGVGFDKLAGVLTELQGLRVNVVAGAGANTKMNLAAIRPEDTIVSVIQFAAGVPSDVTATTTISPVKATGTITIGAIVANATAQINGKTYTFKAAGTADPMKMEVNMGANTTEHAANLAKKVNQVEGFGVLTATSALAVVTLTANAEGTAGNAITTVGSTNVTASGATLAGGTTTGGIANSVSTASNQLVVVWFNKK